MKRTKRVEGLLCSHAKLQGSKAQLCLLVTKSGPKNFSRQFSVLWWMLSLDMSFELVIFSSKVRILFLLLFKKVTFSGP